MNLQAASYAANVMHMVPKMNSYSIDEFFEVVPDDQNHWYQYHFDTQEEIDNIEQLVKKVGKMPSVKGFFSTSIWTILVIERKILDKELPKLSSLTY